MCSPAVSVWITPLLSTLFRGNLRARSKDELRVVTDSKKSILNNVLRRLRIISNIKDIIDNTEGRSELDASVKEIFTIKPIAARIIKTCVPWYKNCSVEEIEQLIEGEPKLHQVPLHRNAKPTLPIIVGSESADKTVDEGNVFFDLKFDIALPSSVIKEYHLEDELEEPPTPDASKSGDGGQQEKQREQREQEQQEKDAQKKPRKNRTILRSLHMIMNFEGQGVFRPGYPVIPRGEFYGARIVSMQDGSVFEGDDYGHLEKTYSIWVFMDTPKAWKNLILGLRPELYVIHTARLADTEEEKKARLDALEISPYSYGLINVVMICLGEANETDVPLLKLLDTVIPDSKTSEQKLEAMKNDGIAITDRMENIVESMYSFSDVIEARGENISAVKSIREWFNESEDERIPISKIIKYIRVTLAQFKAVVDMLSAHKDWDDKKIAKEIDWLELA